MSHLPTAARDNDWRDIETYKYYLNARVPAEYMNIECIVSA